jgi:hypothetical protein
MRWGVALDADPNLNPLWHKATLLFRLISAPSQSRLWAHIARCAAANPWLPAMDAHSGDRDRRLSGTPSHPEHPPKCWALPFS